MLQAVSSQFCSTLWVTWKLRRRAIAQLHQLAWLPLRTQQLGYSNTIT
jgi:hypothetical protein